MVWCKDCKMYKGYFKQVNLRTNLTVCLNFRVYLNKNFIIIEQLSNVFEFLLYIGIFGTWTFSFNSGGVGRFYADGIIIVQQIIYFVRYCCVKIYFHICTQLFPAFCWAERSAKVIFAINYQDRIFISKILLVQETEWYNL